MKKIRGFCDGCERYDFDFGKCCYSNGWAQVDTEQDAWYYGNWIHLAELKMFSFVEGDTCLTECESVDELRAEMQSLIDFELSGGRRPARIDPGWSQESKQAFIDAGFEEMLH